MKDGPAPLWQRLWPLAGLVLAVHLLLLHGGWHALTPTRDRWVQQFTTRIISVPTPAPAPVAPARPQAVATAPAPPPPVAPPPEKAPGPRPRAESTPPVPPTPAPQASTPEASTPPTAATPFVPNALGVPQPNVMRYEVAVQARGGLGFTGQARLDWWHNGQQYDLRLELTGLGPRDRTQESSGQITEEGLAPNRFLEKARAQQATHFDRSRKRVVFSNNQPEAPLLPGMQDRLSVIVQLSMLLSGEPARFPPGTQLAIPTASTRDAQDWVFRVDAEEDLDLPGGKVRALKLERLPRREYDQRIELWLAPGKDYAPVRLRLTNPDGGSVDQRWSSTDKG